ncbi:MAG: hypothetical protein PHO28_02000 [Candidatus Pacebacteria bacterium]|nr:hypothetical protein [Candidatus Paceibacterota bacterium]
MKKIKKSYKPITKKINFLFKKKMIKILRNFNSIEAIDESNLKIVEYNGLLEKKRQEAREKFCIPFLEKNRDEREKIYTDLDLDKQIEIIVSNWEDSLSPRTYDDFQKFIYKALKDLGLSYSLHEWLRGYILYNEKMEIDEFYYFKNGFTCLKSFFSFRGNLSTSEKKLIKETLKTLKYIARKKDIKNYEKFLQEIKKWLAVVEKANPKKERRKRVIDTAIKIIEDHGRTEGIIDPVENKLEKIKITDKEIAARLSEERNKEITNEAIKKIRQRYKTKIKK